MRIKELDVLRGFAALLVLFFHFTIGRPESQLGFKVGTTGVDLFFIISGFVIFMSLSNVKTSLEFIINRVSRLYPTYWASVIISFIIIKLILHNPGGLGLFFGNMTMFQYYLAIPDIEAPYWTLIIEMIFYIFMVSLFQFKILKYVITIGIILSILIVIAANFGFHIWIVRVIWHAIPFIQFCPLFFSGILFYNLYHSKDNQMKNNLMLVFFMISQIMVFKYSGRSSGYISQFEYAIMIGLYFTLFWLFVYGKLRWIITPVTVFFGKISFALYLIHHTVTHFIVIPYCTNELGIGFYTTIFFIAFPIVIILASLIYYFIEVPLSKKMKLTLRKITIEKKS